MFIFVSIIHVIMSLILIVIVLLQSGKGSNMASAFGGGGSQTMFGSHGAASFLNKLTTVAAIMFMVTSLTLAILSSAPSKTFMDEFEDLEETTEAVPALPGSESPATDEAGEAVPEQSGTTDTGTGQTEAANATAGEGQSSSPETAAPASSDAASTTAQDPE